MPKSNATKPAARGRPALSEESIAQMRAHISTCALKLYQSEGFAAVSMRKLAAEAGCTVMTLYRYFERKIDILRHLWDVIFADLFDHLEDVAARSAPGTERLNAVCIAYVDYWLAHREHYFLVFMSGDVSQSDVSVFVDDSPSMTRFALIGDCLNDALPKATTKDQLHLQTQTLLCGLNGISHNLVTISGFPWADPKDLVRSTVSGILNAD